MVSTIVSCTNLLKVEIETILGCKIYQWVVISTKSNNCLQCGSTIEHTQALIS